MVKLTGSIVKSAEGVKGAAQEIARQQHIRQYDSFRYESQTIGFDGDIREIEAMGSDMLNIRGDHSHWTILGVTGSEIKGNELDIKLNGSDTLVLSGGQEPAEDSEEGW